MMQTIDKYITIRPYSKSIEEWMEDMVIPEGGAGTDCWG